MRPADVQTRDSWVQAHLLDPQATLPFSFVYGEVPSDKALQAWPLKRESRRLDALRTQHELVWKDVGTGLEVRCAAVEYADHPAIEWTVYFRNVGTALAGWMRPRPTN